MNVTEAFEKFRSKISRPTQKEQSDASNRQQDIRVAMEKKFKKVKDFLTGSYARHTKTKPLKDVDIFYVLHDDHRDYRDKKPSELLKDVAAHLGREFPDQTVKSQRRSVCIEFPTSEEERVMSFDVVPVFQKGDNYEMPDTEASTEWTLTNPSLHAEEATAKHAECEKKWKGMVRMIKTWNVAQGKPVKPSFLLEVMALELIRAPFNGDYRYELQSFFASAALRIHNVWPDPAGLGTPISDGMNTTLKKAAQAALEKAEQNCAKAIRLESGNTKDALYVWQEIFGSRHFSVS
jgi:predicted nucleotidyltransferase